MVLLHILPLQITHQCCYPLVARSLLLFEIMLFSSLSSVMSWGCSIRIKRFPATAMYVHAVLRNVRNVFNRRRANMFVDSFECARTNKLINICYFVKEKIHRNLILYARTFSWSLYYDYMIDTRKNVKKILNR